MKRPPHSAQSKKPATDTLQPVSLCTRFSPYLFGVLFIWIVFLCSATTVKIVSLILEITTVLFAVIAFRKLRGRICLPLISLFLFVLIDGVSTFYALSGKFALHEYLKVLSAFCLTLLILVSAGKDKHRASRSIAIALTTASAFASLISIDLISTRWLSEPVMRFLQLFTQDYTELSGLSIHTRINSVFENPNIFAGCSGIAVLLGLGLAVSTVDSREKAAHLTMLYINALAFLLAFSMGASASIAVSFVIILLFTRRGQLAPLLLLMMETFVFCLISATIISKTSLQAWAGIQPFPLISTIVGATALILCDRYLNTRFVALYRNHRVIQWIILAIPIVLVTYVILAYSLTGPIQMKSGDSVMRVVYPKPGSYVLHTESDQPISVRIESEDKSTAAMRNRSELFSGEAEGACFTVPQESMATFIIFLPTNDTCLSRVVLSGENDEIAVPLYYRFLPGFIANRIQGLRANQNLLQRIVFFEDGLKLFHRRPIIGLGMGSFENGVKSVQNFYYETKYAHNHYVQVLAETGVVGFLFFLGLFGISFAALLRGRKSENADPLIPALAATLVFMMIHGFVEVVFSSYAYLPFSFGVFAMINISCGDTLAQPGKRTRTVVLSFMLVWIVVYAVLLGQNILAARLVKQERSMDSLVEAAEMDRFEWADYALSYVYSACNPEAGATVRYQADRFAERLAKVDSNTIPIYLAEYYFQTDRINRAFDMLEKYVNYVASDREGWQRAFNLMENYSQDTDFYRTQVLHIADMMDQWNENHMGFLVVSRQSQAFINTLREISANAVDDEPSA